MADLKEILLGISKRAPHKIRARLNRGDLIQKNETMYYEIDDPAIHTKLPGYKPGAIPYGQVHKHFKSDKKGIYDLFRKEGKKKGDKIVLPFSRVHELGLGECLEKAVMMQLASQDHFDSFLVNGSLSQEGGVGAENHAYNVVALNGQLHLVDAQNPIKGKDGEISQAYVAQLENFDEKLSRFRQHPEWEKLGRYYEVE